MKQCIDYKLAVAAYKTRSTVVPVKCRRSLRTMNQADHCSRLISFYCVRLVLDLFALKKAFIVNAPMVWNSYRATVDRLSHCLLLNGFLNPFKRRQRLSFLNLMYSLLRTFHLASHRYPAPLINL